MPHSSTYVTYLLYKELSCVCECVYVYNIITYFIPLITIPFKHTYLYTTISNPATTSNNEHLSSSTSHSLPSPHDTMYVYLYLPFFFFFFFFISGIPFPLVPPFFFFNNNIALSYLILSCSFPNIV